MLRHLFLRQFALIDRLELELPEGMTVLTGETGAGKSILIDAIGLLLGDRGGSEWVRTGATEAVLRAEFEIHANPEARALLAEQGLAGAEPDWLTLRRVLPAQGRGRAFVNDQPVSLDTLRQLGETLIDIHGQHAHQLLLRPAVQRDLLDRLGKIDTQPVAEAWADWRAAGEALAGAREDATRLEERLERIDWQCGQLERLQPGANEYPELSEEQYRLAHLERLLRESREAADLLQGEALDALGTALTRLLGLVRFDPRLAALTELLESARIQIAEAAGELDRYSQSRELDPDRLSVVEARLSDWHELARRLRQPAEELATFHEALKAERLQLSAAADLEALERAAAEAETRYQAAAARVTAARTATAQTLAAELTAAVHDLGMARAQCLCAVEPCAPGAHGADQVQLLLAANPGDPARPLEQVASGGELSRISLALRVLTSAAGSVGTLIFDEVDTGISGATAEVVGQLLARLGQSRQVLCVTHLPQVAAQAQAQIVVSKRQEADRTQTELRLLDRNGRIEELARLLGGVILTAQTRAHAEELLRLAGH